MIKNLRLSKGWSQEQLAQLSGLSVRTIQRVESGNSAGLESLKCIAAVLEVDISSLSSSSTNKNYEFRGAYPILPVINIPETVHFFTENLNFKSHSTNEQDKLSIVTRDNTALELQFINLELAGSGFCTIFVKNITAIYAEFSNKNIPIIENTVDKHGQLKEFYIYDNNGNTLIFKSQDYKVTPV